MSKAKINILTKEALNKSQNLILNTDQLNLILNNTPKKYIKERPGKGGGTWSYINVIYITKVLNLTFGWDWDFEIVDEQILKTQVVVKGRLTCRVKGTEITKMQYGRKDIVFKKGTDEPLDIGNDFKSASSDALKKCASLIGIASDIYGGDFVQTVITKPETDEDKEKVRLLSWIEESETLEKLSTINEVVYGFNDNVLNNMYEKKFNILQEKNAN